MAVVEAYAAGVPVVGFRHGSIGSILEVQPYESCVPYADYGALAQLAAKTCSMDANDWVRLSETVREVHRRSYSMDAIAAQLSHLYERLYAGKR